MVDSAAPLCAIRTYKQDGRRGARYEFEKRNYAILGSHEDSDLRILTGNLPKFCALIQYKNGRVAISALDSQSFVSIPRTGVTLVKSQVHDLEDGDRFFIGEKLFSMEIGDQCPKADDNAVAEGQTDVGDIHGSSKAKARKKKGHRLSLVVTDNDEQLVQAPATRVLPKANSPDRISAHFRQQTQGANQPSFRGPSRASVGGMDICITYSHSPSSNDSLTTVNPTTITDKSQTKQNEENSHKQRNVRKTPKTVSRAQDIDSEMSDITATILIKPSNVANAQSTRRHGITAGAKAKSTPRPDQSNDKYTRLMQGLSAAPLKRTGSVRKGIRTTTSTPKPVRDMSAAKENIPHGPNWNVVNPILTPGARPGLGSSGKSGNGATPVLTSQLPKSTPALPTRQLRRGTGGSNLTTPRTKSFAPTPSPRRKGVNFASTELGSGSHYSPWNKSKPSSSPKRTSKPGLVRKSGAVPRPSPRSASNTKQLLGDRIEGPPPDPSLAGLGKFFYRSSQLPANNEQAAESRFGKGKGRNSSFSGSDPSNPGTDNREGQQDVSTSGNRLSGLLKRLSGRFSDAPAAETLQREDSKAGGECQGSSEVEEENSISTGESDEGALASSGSKETTTGQRSFLRRLSGTIFALSRGSGTSTPSDKVSLGNGSEGGEVGSSNSQSLSTANMPSSNNTDGLLRRLSGSVLGSNRNSNGPSSIEQDSLREGGSSDGYDSSDTASSLSDHLNETLSDSEEGGLEDGEVSSSEGPVNAEIGSAAAPSNEDASRNDDQSPSRSEGLATNIWRRLSFMGSGNRDEKQYVRRPLEQDEVPAICSTAGNQSEQSQDEQENSVLDSSSEDEHIVGFEDQLQSPNYVVPSTEGTVSDESVELNSIETLNSREGSASGTSGACSNNNAATGASNNRSRRLSIRDSIASAAQAVREHILPAYYDSLNGLTGSSETNVNQFSSSSRQTAGTEHIMEQDCTTGEAKCVSDTSHLAKDKDISDEHAIQVVNEKSKLKNEMEEAHAAFNQEHKGVHAKWNVGAHEVSDENCDLDANDGDKVSAKPLHSHSDTNIDLKEGDCDCEDQDEEPDNIKVTEGSINSRFEHDIAIMQTLSKDNRADTMSQLPKNIKDDCILGPFADYAKVITRQAEVHDEIVEETATPDAESKGNNTERHCVSNEMETVEVSNEEVVGLTAKSEIDAVGHALTYNIAAVSVSELRECLSALGEKTAGLKSELFNKFTQKLWTLSGPDDFSQLSEKNLKVCLKALSQPQNGNRYSFIQRILGCLHPEQTRDTVPNSEELVISSEQSQSRKLLLKRKVAELRNFGLSFNIEIPKKLRKAELIELLIAHGVDGNGLKTGRGAKENAEDVQEEATVLQNSTRSRSKQKTGQVLPVLASGRGNVGAPVSRKAESRQAQSKETSFRQMVKKASGAKDGKIRQTRSRATAPLQEDAAVPEIEEVKTRRTRRRAVTPRKDSVASEARNVKTELGRSKLITPQTPRRSARKVDEKSVERDDLDEPATVTRSTRTRTVLKKSGVVSTPAPSEVAISSTDGDNASVENKALQKRVTRSNRVSKPSGASSTVPVKETPRRSARVRKT